MKQFCAKFMAASGENIFCCGSGMGGASVDAYGVLQPCLLLRHPDVVYDLEKGSLRDAMENFFPAMRRRKSDNAEYLVRCARCFLKGLCEQCPAKSWMEHGTLDTPVEYHCNIAHLQARFMGLIGENELAWEVVDGKSRVEKFVNQDEQPAPA
jgi:radical SAM protein with 4Fe4S-binding SPASM domain